MAVSRWLMVFMLLVAVPALAGPTRSGKLSGYTPGQADFVLIGEDGKHVRVRLVSNARYEICGRPSASSGFRDGMQVAVRVCGALNEKPLQADMLMDLYSSSNHVQTSAHAPYNTPQGDFAFPGGVGGLSSGTPGITGPGNVLGQIAQGGNFPGSNSNPNPGQLPPGSIQQTNGQTFPVNQAPGAGPMPPAGPFQAEVMSQQPRSADPHDNIVPMDYNTMYAPMPADIPLNGGNNGAATQGGFDNSMWTPPANQGSYNQGGSYPYNNPGQGGPPQGAGQYGFNQSSSVMMGNGDPQTDLVSAQARMMSNDDEDDPDNDDTGMITSAMKGPQIVTWNAQVMQIDPARRMLVVQPAGMSMPQQVMVPPSVAIPGQALQPGAYLQIIGLSNPAGFVEAQSIHPMEGQSP